MPDPPSSSAGAGRPAGAPSLRASDADRDRVVAVIRAAVGDGRLAMAEFGPRIESALTAQTLADLAAVTADLEPARHPGVAPEVKDVVRIKQSGGSIIRSGRWVLPRRLELRTKWCDVTLDCTAAVNLHGTLELALKVRGGSLTLLGGAGLAVDIDDLAVRYTDVDLGSPVPPGAPTDLAVHLSGSTRYGHLQARRAGA